MLRNLICTLFLLVLVTACGGGGGGGGSSAPPPPAPPPADPGSASDDSVSIIEDNTVQIDVLANDANVVSGTLSVQSGPSNGSAQISGGQIVYTPAADFVGSDSLTYAVDGEDGVAVTADVDITVEPILVTSMEFRTLTLPTSGYAAVNDAELGASILASPAQQIDVPPNTISLLLNLSGPAAGLEGDELFISELVPPSGPFAAFQNFVNYCSEGLCSSLVPRLPGYEAEAGTWQFRVATRGSSEANINFDQMTLTAVIRTGPKPDTEVTAPAAVTVQPFLASSILSVADVDSVMARYVEIALENRLSATIEPVIVVEDTALHEVSSSFLAESTMSLVSQGRADTLNLFFIEDFSDSRGLVGKSGGIPAKPGSQNGFNGSLLDFSILREGPDEFFIKNSAAIAFHESGHLLGLYHTTEGDFSAIDVLDDTPICEEAVHDDDNNGIASVAECPDGLNPMFWTTDLESEPGLLTNDQQHVIFYSPLAVPGSD